MGYKIYAPKPIDEYCMKLLEKKGFEFIGVWKDSREDMKKYMSECDVAIARVHFFDDELLGLASHMKLLEVHGVGYQDHVICEDAAKRGIYVAYSAIFSLTAFWARIHTIDLRLYPTDLLKAVGLCVIEVSCLRFILAWVRIIALIGYRKKKATWGQIQRQEIKFK